MTAHVLHGDATSLPLRDASVDAVVCDPPYELNFMAKTWDASGVAFDPATWREALRILKPGGYLLAFGGSRTWHRLACAIEDAGFELRDSIAWMYGSGFPKSLDVSKAIDKAAGAEREVVGTNPKWNTAPRAMNPGGGDRQAMPGYTAPATDAARQWQGWGTALKPAFEPIVVARKPLIGTVVQNVTMHGTGALNIDGCRVAHGADVDLDHQQRQSAASAGMSALGGSGFRSDHEQATYNPSGRWPSNVVLSHSPSCEQVGDRKVRGDQRIGGDGTRAGGFGDVRGQTDGNGRPAGRLYGNEQVPVMECEPGCPVAALDQQSGTLKSGANPTRRGSDKFRDAYGEFRGQEECTPARGADQGGASRFFPTFRYQAKAPSRERPVGPDGTKHPTCKPLDLMRWLVRLVTPPGGIVLDPFAGSGTTLEAAQLEGFAAIGVEKHAPYLPLIEQRLERSAPRPPEPAPYVAPTPLTLFDDDEQGAA